MISRLAALALLLFTAACGGGSGSGPAGGALAFTAEPASSSAVAPLSPVVTVELRGADGVRLAGATSSVTLGLAPAGGAILTGTTTRAAVAGVATFPDLVVSRAGSGYQLIASAAGYTDATSAAFTVAAGPAAALAVVSHPGDGRTGVPLVPALQVSVKDAAGNPVEDGAQVTASLVPGGAGGPLTGTAAVSTASGLATFPDLAVGGAGAHALRAAVTGGPSVTTATFTLTDAWFPIGPDGGRVAVAADLEHPPTALAGGEGSAGLWRTGDGGVSWAPVAALRGRTLTPAFEPAGVAWAYGDSLWRSGDGGLSWVQSADLALSTSGQVAGVALDAVTGVTYVAISDYTSRLLATSDGGATLTPVSPALPEGARLLEVATGPGGLYVITSQGFQALARGAPAWTAPVAVDTNPYRLLAHPTKPLILFAAGFFGLHRSTNGGASWEVVADGAVLDLWIDPAQDTTVLAIRSNATLLVSGDGGATFPTTVSLPASEGLSLSGTSARLYAGADSGPYRSLDGGASWTGARGGLHARRFEAVAVSSATPPVVLAGADRGALFRSVDGGGTFAPVPSGSGYEARQLLFDPLDPNRAYFVNGYLMASDDAGVNWSILGAAPPGIARVSLCRQVPATLWATDQNGSGVWRSLDGGATFTRSYTHPDANLVLNDVAADAADPRVATFAAIDFASGGARTGLWQTRDAGASWTKLAEPFYGIHLVEGLAAGSLWALAHYELKVTTDLGETFATVRPPMSGSPLALAVDPADGGHLALGTVQPYAYLPSDGVWLTADGGATWTQARSGHDLFSTYDLAFDPTNAATMYAATLGGGLLKTTTGGL
jgi:photosystem II stability/assembly factor-like uncharacterized protein